MAADRPGFIRCEEIFGTCNVRHSDPQVRTFFDVVCTPYVADGQWGVFDANGAPIEACIDRRETHYLLMRQIPKLPAIPNVINLASDNEYIYGGRFNPHYGHFLVESLPRLWLIHREGLRGRKILMHGDGDLGWWFGYEHVRAIWGGLGLTPDDFVQVREPIRVRQLTVPLPSLQQQTYGHPVYGAMCRRIGAGVLGHGASPPARSSVPVYLSKTRLSSGVGIVLGEDVVEARLAAEGVDIIHPQDMSLPDQIALFDSREVVLGTAGSAFHTSILSSRPSRQIALSPIAAINSNYVLFDRLAQTTTEQYFQVGSRDVGGDERFLSRRQLADPAAAAEDLLSILRNGPREP